MPTHTRAPFRASDLPFGYIYPGITSSCKMPLARYGWDRGAQLWRQAQVSSQTSSTVTFIFKSGGCGRPCGCATEHGHPEGDFHCEARIAMARHDLHEDQRGQSRITTLGAGGQRDQHCRMSIPRSKGRCELCNFKQAHLLSKNKHVHK